MNYLKNTVCLISIICIAIISFYFLHQKISANTIVLTPDSYDVAQETMPLVVILMVKNEADFMAKTLMPFVNAGVQGYLILDTGSTDETIARTQQFFKDQHVKYGYIVEQPFIDFAASRNYALECAEKLFPHAYFFFMIDAEWYTQNVPELLKFCTLYAHEPIEAFKILIHYKQKQYYVSRILKADKKVRFTSVVHEYPQIKTCMKLPETICIDWDDSDKGFEKSKERWKRDIKLLLKQHEQHPDDLRTLYYIGQTYTDLQEYEQAIFWYKKRYENTNGWLEERLLSCTNIAKIYDLALKNWPLALDYYLKAYELNPNRAEPVIAIAQHYLQTKDYHTCFLFAYQAVKIPYPTDAVSIIPDQYNYVRYDILSAAAYNIGEYEIGEQALNIALKLNPKDTHLLQNLKAFIDKKGNR